MRRDHRVEELASARPALQAWFRRARRDLPWRRRRDPYGIWVSEIMLQQTRAGVVEPFYERFMERFPNVASLAAARLEEVLQAWAGLGYYRRARCLHAAAKQVVHDHGGRLPAAPGALEALPGIGRYTAGAIRSIAFEEPAPILDGNVARVFARFYGFEAALESSAARKQLWSWASAWAAGPAPGTTNQALMELGATVCVPVKPLCVRCPLARPCVARRSLRTEALPRPRVRPPARRCAMVAAIIRRRNRVLLVQRRSGGLLRDWWELPACASPAATFAARLAARLGVEIGPAISVGRVRHSILANDLDVEVILAAAKKVRTTGVTHHGAAVAIARSRRPAAQNPVHAAARARAHGANARARERGVTRLANLDLPDLVAKWVGEEELTRMPVATLSRKALELRSHARAKQKRSESAVRTTGHGEAGTT